MPSPYTAKSQYHDTLQVPVDGDPGAEATFRGPYEALADNTAWLRDQRNGMSDQWRLNQILEAFLNPQQRFISGIAGEAFGGAALTGFGPLGGDYIGINGTYFTGGISDRPRVNYSFDGKSWAQFADSGAAGHAAFVLDYSTDDDGPRLFYGSDGGLTQLYSVSSLAAPTAIGSGGGLSLASGVTAGFYGRLGSTTRIIAWTGDVHTSDDGHDWTHRGSLRLTQDYEVHAIISGVTDRGIPVIVLSTGGVLSNTGEKVFYTKDPDALIWMPVAVDNSITSIERLYYTGLPGMRFVGIAMAANPDQPDSLWVSDDAVSWRRAKTLSSTFGRTSIIPTPYGILVPDGIVTWFTRDAVTWTSLPPKPAVLTGSGKLVDAGNNQSILLLDGVKGTTAPDNATYTTYSGPRYAPLLLV